MTRKQSHQKNGSNHDKEAEIVEIYEAYPRHVGRSAALRAIRSALGRLDDGKSDVQYRIRWLLDRVLTYSRSPAGHNGIYTPHPSTWFNQERYLDDEKEWFRTGREAFVSAKIVVRGQTSGQKVCGIYCEAEAEAEAVVERFSTEQLRERYPAASEYERMIFKRVVARRQNL